MAEPDAKQVEAVARAICVSRMDDMSTHTPDSEVLSAYGSVPAWRLYEDNARAVLALPWLASALRLAEAGADVREKSMEAIKYAYDEKEAVKRREARAEARRADDRYEDALAAYRAARRDLEGGA